MTVILAERVSDWWCSILWCWFFLSNCVNCSEALWYGRITYTYQSKPFKIFFLFLEVNLVIFNMLFLLTIWISLHIFLKKISLLAPQDRENIQLLPSIKAVKDLRVSPHAKLALLASLGKKLSVIRWICSLSLSHQMHYTEKSKGNFSTLHIILVLFLCIVIS